MHGAWAQRGQPGLLSPTHILFSQTPLSLLSACSPTSQTLSPPVGAPSPALYPSPLTLLLHAPCTHFHTARLWSCALPGTLTSLFSPLASMLFSPICLPPLLTSLPFLILLIYPSLPSLNPTAPLNTSSLSQHPHSPHTPSQSWKLDSIPIERHTTLRGLVADPG